MIENQRFGRWMILGAWLLLILLLTLLFSQWLDKQQNPNRALNVTASEDGNQAVVLKRNRAGHYVAPGFINGIGVTFLLDTGATYVAVSSSLADRVGLRRGMPLQSRTANGVVRSWLTEIDQLRLGPIEMRNVRATILPSMPDDEVLLGMSFLKHLSLTQQGGELLISPHN
jgi:aspartyl protease family protein